LLPCETRSLPQRVARHPVVVYLERSGFTARTRRVGVEVCLEARRKRVLVGDADSPHRRATEAKDAQRTIRDRAIGGPSSGKWHGYVMQERVFQVISAGNPDQCAQHDPILQARPPDPSLRAQQAQRQRSQRKSEALYRPSTRAPPFRATLVPALHPPLVIFQEKEKEENSAEFDPCD